MNETQILLILENALKVELEAIFDKKKEEMIEEMDRKKDEILASITLRIMKRMNIQSNGTTLTIELSTKPLTE